MEGQQKFLRGGGESKESKVLKHSNALNWNFLRGVVGGGGGAKQTTFHGESGTAHRIE